MAAEIKIPSVGESITEVTISQWMKKDGDYVNVNDVLLMVETDKATVEVVADKAGKLTIKTPAGQVTTVGSVVGEIDTSAAPSASAPTTQTASVAAPLSATSSAPLSAAKTQNGASDIMMPAAKKMAAENNISTSELQGSGRGGRILKEDVQRAVDTKGSNVMAMPSISAPAAKKEAPPVPPQIPNVSRGERGTRTVPMSTIRKRIAKRLVDAQHTAAILTTFNEVDMSAYNRLRDTYGDKFKEKYGTRLGFLGLFAKACVEGLKAYPGINAFIDGDNILYNDFYSFGIAVSTEQGLVVPVVRDVDLLSVAQIELEIKRLAIKARDGKLTVDDMRGGTFTISNGGVFGSLMSTPILNAPQSGILGLHKVEDRPMAINGKVEIRPMMYIALSYDHRMVDGKEAVSFLVKVKESMEDPQRLILEI